jgi:hypothetical protein|tara:strand:+ start:210 stop:1184 length:975 start_codon:yes stop_codon:yes gene_type:complete
LKLIEGSEIMGLLDKASDVGSKSTKKPVAKAVAKAVPVAKAVAKARPVAKAVAKARPAQEVVTAKAVKPKKVRATPEGLPGDFEIASPNARRIAGLTNFVVNLGPIFGFLFSVTILDAFTTIFAIIALAALTLNLIIVPIMSGRTLGNFVSRTKNITSAGNKPNFLHALFVNSTGILALLGIIFLMIFAGSIFSTKGSEQIWASVWSILGVTFIILYFVNSSMKKGSESNQGLYDSLFGAFLVKHVPAEGEVSTGFIGKLEGMASYGDRFTQRQEDKSAKKAAKLISDAESKKAALVSEKDEPSKDESESIEDKKEKKDKKKAK